VNAHPGSREIAVVSQHQSQTDGPDEKSM
jgi:hypothetical protein